MKLEKQIYDKINRILKPYYKNESYELNYLIVDNELTIFASINECEKLPEGIISQVASALDGAYNGCTNVNQEFRYKFILNPCD